MKPFWRNHLGETIPLCDGADTWLCEQIQAHREICSKVGVDPNSKLGQACWKDFWQPMIEKRREKTMTCDDCKCEETPISLYDGTPLQDQVEQVEDALSKALDVIEAMVAQQRELRNDVYQAQVDAQDWQNKYNALDSESKDYIADRERLIDNCRDLYREECIKSDRLQERIELLTQQNTALELRNENQCKIITAVRSAFETPLDISKKLR